MWIRLLIVLSILLSWSSLAQDTPQKAPSNKAPSQSQEPEKPGSTPSAPSQSSSGPVSSSRDTRIDISPPKDDDKRHPASKEAVEDLDVSDNPNPDVQEFHPWNPHKSMKDIEVGDFYFKRKNYKAALERYKEALFYKDGDAVAISRLATCLDKLGDKTEARKYYEEYLKILPEGPFAKDAHASLDRLAKAQ